MVKNRTKKDDIQELQKSTAVLVVDDIRNNKSARLNCGGVGSIYGSLDHRGDDRGNRTVAEFSAFTVNPPRFNDIIIDWKWNCNHATVSHSQENYWKTKGCSQHKILSRQKNLSRTPHGDPELWQSRNRACFARNFSQSIRKWIHTWSKICNETRTTEIPGHTRHAGNLLCTWCVDRKFGTMGENQPNSSITRTIRFGRHKGNKTYWLAEILWIVG